jgi:hypothetical protein
MLRKYAAELVEENSICYVALALVGALLLYKDPDANMRITPPILGTRGSVLYVSIGKWKYVIYYNGASSNILLRLGGLRGDIVASFSNRTPLGQLADVFQKLRK